MTTTARGVRAYDQGATLRRNIVSVLCLISASVIAGLVALIPLTAHKDRTKAPVRVITMQDTTVPDIMPKSFRDEIRAEARIPVPTTVAPVIPVKTTIRPRAVIPIRVIRASPGATRLGRPRVIAGPGASGGAFACIRQRESGGNYATNTGNGYYGAYQFLLSTWRSVGGTGLPSSASPAEQDARARMLQQRAGWSQWSTAGGCGV